MKTSKRQKIWNVLLILAILGVVFITMISFQVSPTNPSEDKTGENTESLIGSNGLVKKDKNQENKTEVKNSSYNFNNSKLFFIALGTGLLIAGASFSSGALSGFLFGIPRIINSSAPKSAEISQNVILHNDNLVQISDWLTKIIVGVGLTQINSLPEKLNSLGKVISPCFNISIPGESDSNIKITISISILIYFLILGFITSYLWTRIYFGDILKQVATVPSNLSQDS